MNVTRLISFTEVTPSRTFSSAAWRNVLIPFASARLRISEAPADRESSNDHSRLETTKRIEGLLAR